MFDARITHTLQPPYQTMRTTLAIDDDVLAAAKSLA